jgi:hypothetical protein
MKKNKLYIGLGGTGSRVLQSIKKQLEIEYNGKLPAHIKFLLVDVDQHILNEWSKSESVHIPLKKPNKLIQEPAVKKWLTEDVLHKITPTSYGSKQLKPIGRLAYWANILPIESKINEILQPNTWPNLAYSYPEVELIFSAAGGTGAGIYLDLSWFIRRINHQIKINASIILGNAFSYFPFTDKVLANTYATLLELDLLQNNNLNTNYSSHYPTQATPCFFEENKLFDQIFLFEEKLKNGSILDHDNLIEAIAQTMISKEKEVAYTEMYDIDLFKSILEDGRYKSDFIAKNREWNKIFYLDKYFEKNIKV